MKRLLYIISQDHDGESWKGAPADLDAVREQLLEQLRQPVPVLCLPPGAHLWTIELGEDEKPASEKPAVPAVTDPPGED